MKIYHTETQEDYDALMEELEREGIDTFSTNVWPENEKETGIRLGNDDFDYGYGPIDWYAIRHPNIPIIEYKANHNDPINPKHYTQGELEVIDILQDKLTSEEFEGFLKGNILKYTFREGIKNGTEDMKKGAWYMARLIEFRKGKEE